MWLCGPSLDCGSAPPQRLRPFNMAMLHPAFVCSCSSRSPLDGCVVADPVDVEREAYVTEFRKQDQTTLCGGMLSKHGIHDHLAGSLVFPGDVELDDRDVHDPCRVHATTDPTSSKAGPQCVEKQWRVTFAVVESRR